MDHLTVEDLLNVISGKISEKDLDKIINDDRPIKNNEDMEDFLEDIYHNVRQKRKRERKLQKMEELQEKRLRNSVKKVGPIMMLAANHNKRNKLRLSKVLTEKFSNSINQHFYGKSSETKLKEVGEVGELSESSDSESGDMSSSIVNTEKTEIHDHRLLDGKDMIDELLRDIDRKIDKK